METGILLEVGTMEGGVTEEGAVTEEGFPEVEAPAMDWKAAELTELVHQEVGSMAWEVTGVDKKEVVARDWAVTEGAALAVRVEMAETRAVAGWETVASEAVEGDTTEGD